MDEITARLSKRQMRALIRYCWLYGKPLNLTTVTHWVAMRAKSYRRNR